MTQKSLPLPIGGEYVAGHPALMPDGYCRFVQNMLQRPGRWESRPALTDEGIGVIYGFGLWDDPVNKVVRLVSVTGGGTADLNVKAVSGETWGGAITGPSDAGTYATSCTYRGVFYYTMFTASLTAEGAPTGLHSYNGTTITQYPLGGEQLYSVTIIPFGDRLILGHVSASVVNQLGTTTAYDATSWSAVSISAQNITSGAAVTSRITPTATTGGVLFKADVYTVAAGTTDTSLIFHVDFRSATSVVEIPLTISIYYSQIWVTLTPYALTTIRIPTSGNGYRYRVTVAGTTAAGEPTWPTTIGTTVVDGTVTWICDGPNAIGSIPVTLPPVTTARKFSAFSVSATIPPLAVSTKVGVSVNFGNPGTPVLTTLDGLDVSFKDGLTDGVVGKANKGFQLTAGKFSYPFFNQQSSATATIDLDNDLYWTETADPNSIYGVNSFRMQDSAGGVTALCVAGGKLIAFKRRGMWIFSLTADPDNPLQLDKSFSEFGCVGPKAVTVFEDTVYFVSDLECYSYQVGGKPEPLFGPGLRERATGSKSNRTSLAVDQVNRELWVCNEAATVASFVMNLESKQWSEQLIGTGNGLIYPIYNPNTQKMYICYGATVSPTVRSGARLDGTGTDLTSTAIVKTITFRPLQAIAPQKELNLEGIHLYHSTSVSQASQTFRVYVSLDGGGTFSKYNEVVLPVTVSASVGTSTFIPLRKGGQNLIIQLYHSGSGGAGIFTPCMVEAVVQEVGTQRGLGTPTQGTPNL